MGLSRSILVWAALGVALAVPVIAAIASPLLAWRDPVYIIAGLAGIIALCGLLVQPLLMGGYLPGLSVRTDRRIHRWVGGMLVAAVTVHVGGLWLTSPPDVIDALTFSSPTPFSVWGVTAMWAVFAAALLAALRRRLRVRPYVWRVAHTSLALVIVLGTAIHALLIEGTMEMVSKAALCGLVLVATVKVFVDLRVWARRKNSR